MAISAPPSGCLTYSPLGRGFGGEAWVRRGRKTRGKEKAGIPLWGPRPWTYLFFSRTSYVQPW